jgi:protein SCO1
MKPDNKFPIALLVGVLVSFILGITALLVITIAARSRSNLPMLGQVPDFEFVKQDGTPFGLRNMQGKINVVDFMFTSCRGPCPAMSGNMANLYREYSAAGKVQFVSISVDPDRDSLSVLRSYGEAMGVNDNRWVFLWHPIDEVARLSEKGFMLSSQNLPGGHSSMFALVDDKGQIRGYYDGLSAIDMKLLTRDINQLVRSIK